MDVVGRKMVLFGDGYLLLVLVPYLYKVFFAAEYDLFCNMKDWPLFPCQVEDCRHILRTYFFFCLLF